MGVSPHDGIFHCWLRFACSRSWATQYMPFPSKSGLKHRLQEPHCDAAVSPLFQRAASPGSLINGRLSETKSATPSSSSPSATGHLCCQRSAGSSTVRGPSPSSQA
jgi:hypothetical protein